MKRVKHTSKVNRNKIKPRNQRIKARKNPHAFKNWSSVKVGIIVLLITFVIGYYANSKKVDVYVSPDTSHKTAVPQATPTTSPTPSEIPIEQLREGVKKLEQIENTVPKKEDALGGGGAFAENSTVPTPVLTQTPNPTPTAVPTPDEKAKLRERKLTEKRQIQDYIRKIFAKVDPQTAIAVSLAESGVGSINGIPMGEVVYKEEAEAKSSIEHSVGIFQINLYNAQHKVHADRIPGSTMEEKIEWLKDPYNNTLYAFWVYVDRQNWKAWSVFTNGRYQRFLGEK